MPPPSQPCHKRDGRWIKDLLWEYLHEQPRNHWVYEIIVDPAQANKNRIPWNQFEPSFLKRMENMRVSDPGLACGTAVKEFLQKYMKTCPLQGDPWAHPLYPTPKGDPPRKGPLPRSGKCSDIKLNSKDVKASMKLIKKLLDNGRAVRLPLVHTKARFFPDIHNSNRIAPHHYVGIVGYDKDDSFLYIDPFAGFAGTHKYAEADSQFIGVMIFDGQVLRPRCSIAWNLGTDCVVIAAPMWVPANCLSPSA